jgi:hypothetical protein
MTTTGDASAGAGNSSRWRHPANRHLDRRSHGERIADRVTGVFGSWRFIVVQTVIVTAWIALNLLAVAYRWDPYPFILLNLVFSTQAAYAAPLILLSQNRQADTDRITAEHDYRVNQLALQHLIAWHRDTHGPDCPCPPGRVGCRRPARRAVPQPVISPTCTKRWRRSTAGGDGRSDTPAARRPGGIGEWGPRQSGGAVTAPASCAAAARKMVGALGRRMLA